MIQHIITRVKGIRSATLFATSFSFGVIAWSFFARSAHAATDLKSLICEAGRVSGLLVGLLVGIALVVFLWGLVRLIANAGNEEERKRGRQVMTWGIIAIFVIISIWGIVGFLRESIFSSSIPSANFGNPCDPSPEPIPIPI